MALKLLPVGIDDLVRAVAVNAHRPARVALGEQLAVDALVVSLLDADVAFAAGLGDVRVVDGRIAVHAALDVVRRRGSRRTTARQSNPFSTARVPWMLSMYCVRRLGKFNLIFLGEAVLLWHFAQVAAGSF
jgi:hypothetical protein